MLLWWTEFSAATCEKILFLHGFGLSYRKLVKKLSLNFSNVHYLIKKEKKKTVNKPQTGRPRKLDTRQRTGIIKEFTENPFPSARECRFNVGDSAYTTNNYKYSSWCKYSRKSKSKKKHLLVKRLEFAKAYVSQAQKFWKNAIIIILFIYLFLMKRSLIFAAQMIRKLCGEN